MSVGPPYNLEPQAKGIVDQKGRKVILWGVNLELFKLTIWPKMSILIHFRVKKVAF